MFGKDKKKYEKLDKMIKLANTPDDKIEKMSFREKQAVFKAKSSLSKIVWDSKEKGTYRKPKKDGKSNE